MNQLNFGEASQKPSRIDNRRTQRSPQRIQRCQSGQKIDMLLLKRIATVEMIKTVGELEMTHFVDLQQIDEISGAGFMKMKTGMQEMGIPVKAGMCKQELQVCSHF